MLKQEVKLSNISCISFFNRKTNPDDLSIIVHFNMLKQFFYCRFYDLLFNNTITLWWKAILHFTCAFFFAESPGKGINRFFVQIVHKSPCFRQKRACVSWFNKLIYSNGGIAGGGICPCRTRKWNHRIPEQIIKWQIFSVLYCIIYITNHSNWEKKNLSATILNRGVSITHLN